MRKVETNELRRMLGAHEDLVLVNVLDAESFEREHIPGSHNVPADAPDLVQQVEQIAARKDRQIVVYCSNPKCPASPGAGKKLESAGFTNVAHYAGGIQGWKAAGQELAQGTAVPSSRGSGFTS